MIPDAVNWDPVLKGDPLTSKPEDVAAFADQVNAFLDEND